MISPSNLLSLALLYICILFAVAWWADRRSEQGNSKGWFSRPGTRGIVYALSLAVYCSSWTFYGAVGSATETAWGHAPIYLGPILMFLFGWPVIQRMLAVGERHRVTSIADYIGARYGKRQMLAVLVTLVATAAVLPYIALQFKALSQAWSIVGGSLDEMEAYGGDTALLVAILLAVFTILFGTRRLDGRERHQGMMAAIAVESVVKLVAFVAVAMLAMIYLWGLPADVRMEHGSQALGEFTVSSDFVARTLISALAVLCLPRQFHVMVVEAQQGTNTRMARWIFPVYLALFMVLVVPISVAGSSVFAVSDTISPDTYVQLLPQSMDSHWVTVAAFVGGISAATGMVIVATVSLAIMITNEVVAPIIMRANANSPAAVLKLGDSLRRIRQFTIAGILLAAWLVTQQIMGIPWLAQIGFISFLAAAQLAPGLLAGLYWRRAHGVGVILGLLLGLALWFYCCVLPVVLNADASLLLEGPLGIGWLSPTNLFGIEAENRLAYSTGWSLSVNAAAVVLISLLLKPSLADLRQARLFTEGHHHDTADRDRDFELSLIRVSQLQALLPPFMEADELRSMWLEFETAYQQRLLPGDRAPIFVVNQVESVLARIIGATSAHHAMEQLERSQQLEYSDLAGMVTDASRLNTFNRELLQTTVESLIQGVSVVDKELRLVAWNKRYEEIFHYPERFLYVGCPIERVYRFNAERGILGSGGRPVEEEVSRRLDWLRDGNPHQLERTMPDGTVIDIRGNPLPHGGFVTTYIDITDYRDVVGQLEEAKMELEQKVASGSQTLTETNARLRQENRLRAQVESSLRDAHQSKTRFMSATSHDLLQPINAARLFTAALKPQLREDVGDETRRIVDQIDSSLHRAEQLIAELREISRLDSGKQMPRRSHFAINEIFEDLYREFLPMAEIKGLQLEMAPSSVWLYSDKALLTRVLQNFISNAIKYTREGKVLFGLRRRADSAELQVLDTGPGIAESDQVRVFQEFERLQRHAHQGEEGLGLGLAIVSRYAELLGHGLKLRSEPGRGTCFSIGVTFGQPQDVGRPEKLPNASRDLEGLEVLCLDNDPLILDGMQQLLITMGASVSGVSDREALHRRLAELPRPDIIFADYHLDDGDTGLSAVVEGRKLLGIETPCIIISADDSDVIRDRTKAVGFRFLPKPVNAARLRALTLALTRA
ncbi:hybrid sensor histidine kinase/response regulator [Halioglobus maricola]|uniref:histidine kinase n=1 Tax=Halioglobus maricola TaxID=2601894 RepID=A0A5P9NJC2_9GAMM|nr:PAS domain-containing hybrid sensor histidine kinase/response regulator [Halioglobus maricola]QFU75655.1 hybrid sensor histidine kinase/response regulator [Halioglobus maricola]